MFEFQFDSLADFLNMGGHGFYVWTSYLFFMVVMALNLGLPNRQRKLLVRLLKARQLRQQDMSSINGEHLQAGAQQ